VGGNQIVYRLILSPEVGPFINKGGLEDRTDVQKGVRTLLNFLNAVCIRKDTRIKTSPGNVPPLEEIIGSGCGVSL